MKVMKFLSTYQRLLESPGQLRVTNTGEDVSALCKTVTCVCCCHCPPYQNKTTKSIYRHRCMLSAVGKILK